MANNKILITIDRELIDKFHQYYFKKHPSSRNVPFAKPKNKKQFNRDGSPKLTKSGRQKTKKQSITKKDYKIQDCMYGAMSLNELLVINNRIVMNNKKQLWGELGEWIAKEYELNNKNFSNAMVEFRVYSETKAKKDNDNISAGIKLLNDGLFVKSDMFQDDNYTVLNPLNISCHYDKEYPRTEIRISLFKDDIKDVYEKMKLHIKNFNS